MSGVQGITEPGGTLNSVLAQKAKHVNYQQVTPTGVAILGGAPAVFVSALYGANEPNDKLTGALKLALHALPDTTTLCLHDELGYRATFERASRGFCEAFKPAQPSVGKPNYLEISKTQFDELDVGFAVTKVITGQNPGSVEHVTQTTMLFPTSPKDLVIDDSYCKLELDANQRLQKGTWLDTQSGAVKLQVTLTRSAGGKYAHEGTIHGKPVRGYLSASGSVSTPLDTIALLKRRLKTKKPFYSSIIATGAHRFTARRTLAALSPGLLPLPDEPMASRECPPSEPTDGCSRWPLIPLRTSDAFKTGPRRPRPPCGR